MAKEPRRKFSHCGHNGHNSRTCNGKGCIKLFGFKINVFSDDDVRREEDEDSMRKCKSTGNLQACNHAAVDTGYLSDGLIQSRRDKAAHERRKGRPWSEHEHRSFLMGLEKLGKGDWRGISKTFVPTRTPTQVASHAQKYFLRMGAIEKKKRRASVFDIGLNESHPHSLHSHASLASSSPIIESPDPRKQGNTTNNVLPVTTFERPPLSPLTLCHGASDFRRIPSSSSSPSSYMVRNQQQQNAGASSASSISSSHGQSAAPFVFNFPSSHNYAYLPSFNGKFAVCAAAPVMMPRQFSALPPSQAAPATTTTTHKDGVDLSLGALTL